MFFGQVGAGHEALACAGRVREALAVAGQDRRRAELRHRVEAHAVGALHEHQHRALDPALARRADRRAPRRGSSCTRSRAELVQAQRLRRIGERLRRPRQAAHAAEQRHAEHARARERQRATPSSRRASAHDPADDVDRQVVAAERRHDVRAGDAVLDAAPASRARSRRPRRAPAGPSRPCACARGSARARACRAPRCAGTRRCGGSPAATSPTSTGTPSGAASSRKRSSMLGVVDRLRHHELGAGVDLGAQARDLARVVLRRGLGAGRAQEARRLAERLAARDRARG